MDRTTATIVDGKIIADQPIHWPNGSSVEITLVTRADSQAQNAWPAGYFERTAGALAGEPFERPPQGELPVRDSW